MTLKRFISLIYPLRHKTSVTKRRLTYITVGIEFFSIIIETLSFKFKTSFVEAIIIALLFTVLILMNYKMFVIAKSKSNNTLSKGKKGNLVFRKYYTCLLAVGSFFIFASPSVVYNILELTERMVMKTDSGISLFRFGLQLYFV